MGIALHIDYKFELDGKIYKAMGVDFGETEKKSDIESINADVENNKIAAICNAFDLTIDEYEDEKEKFDNVNFEYVEVYD